MTFMIFALYDNFIIHIKPENLNKTEWEELDKKDLSTIQLCLANTVLQEVLMEKTSSALQRLFTFRMNECELLRDHISQFIPLLNNLKNVEV
ncbi:hypothetical protein Goklo_024819 [Gossypium klotzschianum]|uniref:Uncharacterized protein n=1 Tax=Gossypium klotzschianum TaxID=34286 RepID=A0A7J8WBK3_9ROSI|nr:hypothetical protein [Gossypium klotzschianum]